MAEDGRTVPPPRARLAAAARAGVFPRSRLLVAGATLAAAGAVGLLLGEQIAAVLGALVEQGLSSAVAERGDPGMALASSLGRGLAAILPLVLIPAAVGVVVALIPAIVARRGGGETSVPVPRRPRRFSRGALTAVALAVFVLLALVALRDRGGQLARSVAGLDSDNAWGGDLVALLVLAAGATMALAGLADLALERAHLLRSLALRPVDARREERAASGDPRARAQVRSRLRDDGGAR
jgi:flagellar biosynthesis protein FlhB